MPISNVQLNNVNSNSFARGQQSRSANVSVSFKQKIEDSFVPETTTKKTTKLKNIFGSIASGVRKIVSAPVELIRRKNIHEASEKHRLTALDFDTRVVPRLPKVAETVRLASSQVIRNKKHDIECLIASYKEYGKVHFLSFEQTELPDGKIKAVQKGFKGGVETTCIFDKNTCEVKTISGLIDDKLSFEYHPKDDILHIMENAKEEDGKLSAECRYTYRGSNFISAEEGLVLDGANMSAKSKYQISGTGYSFARDVEQVGNISEVCGTRYDVDYEGRVVAYENFVLDKTEAKTTADKVFEIMGRKLVSYDENYTSWVDMFLNRQVSSKIRYVLEQSGNTEKLARLLTRIRP